MAEEQNIEKSEYGGPDYLRSYGVLTLLRRHGNALSNSFYFINCQVVPTTYSCSQKQCTYVMLTYYSSDVRLSYILVLYCVSARNY